ncbi:hypothetical protein [Actinacidiphila glaucinigra]|uniref:hypothetical protein n=1 Tax=Actinacidiphila glaucinigra TaxID=235986 RepID=UPI0037100DA1
MPRTRSVDHGVTGFDVTLPGTFEEAVRRHESLVPDHRAAEVRAIVRSGGSWESALALAEGNAPHGSMTFWKSGNGAHDPRPGLDAVREGPHG